MDSTLITKEDVVDKFMERVRHKIKNYPPELAKEFLLMVLEDELTSTFETASKWIAYLKTLQKN